MALLEDNYRAGKPLLEDAVLFRGTRLPDQTMGSYSQNEMHGTLLPQVAAGYTHNFDQGNAFIGTYPVDRNTTRFYADYGLEQQLNGKHVQSYSVAEVEKTLEPLVKELAGAASGRDKARIESRIESMIGKTFYEAPIPTKTPSGEPNRPQDLYIYTGRPDVSIRQAVPLSMEKVGPHNENVAKEVMYRESRNEAIKSLHTLASLPTGAEKSLAIVKGVAHAEYAKELERNHGSKSLNDFLTDAAKQPVSQLQQKLGAFGKALADGMNHPDAGTQQRAHRLHDTISKMSPNSVTVDDLVKASAASREQAPAQSSTATQLSGKPGLVRDR